MAAAALVGGSLLVRASATGDRIESSFTKSFIYKNYLKDEHVKISSRDGVVILSGDVSSENHKSMAQDTAEALPGVKSVENRIEVKGDRPAENSDVWVGMKVKTALMFHANVNAFKTAVDVKEGVVTLTGEAASQAQKDLTTEYAKDIVGVKSVKNEMTVAMSTVKTNQTVGEKIDDASITAQVRWLLLSHDSTSMFNTKVATTDGTVTVSGEAKNAAEKALVTKLVTGINGVERVVNNMTIQQP